MREAAPGTEHQGRHERRDARVNVDNRAAGEVQGSHRAQPSIDSPHPVGDEVIGDRRPEEDEDNVRFELHSFDDGP